MIGIAPSLIRSVNAAAMPALALPWRIAAYMVTSSAVRACRSWRRRADRPRPIADDAAAIAGGVSRAAQREPLDRQTAPRGLDQRAAQREMAARIGRSDRLLVEGLDRRRGARVMPARLLV